MPIFYFAIGGRSTLADLRVALAAGQRHVLVPAGTTMAETLRTIPQDVRVVLDSGAWPINNPNRLSIEAYVDAILRWREADGGWGRLDWAASYDHLTDPAASQRDYHRLLGLLCAAGAENAPIVPVLHYPSGQALQVLLDMEDGYAGSRADLVESGGTLTRPCYGVGGLVPALSPTKPQVIFDEADGWYDELLTALEAASDDDGDATIDPDLLQLHLFGIGRPAFTGRSSLISSFDSSGPIRQASFGWQKIAPSYDPTFGLSAEKLQTSRHARLAYWILKYRAAAGLPWQPFVDETILANDVEPPPWIQHALFDMAA